MCVRNTQATAVPSLVQSEELPVVTVGNTNSEDDDNVRALNEWSLVDFARQIAAGMVTESNHSYPVLLCVAF